MLSEISQIWKDKYVCSNFYEIPGKFTETGSAIESIRGWGERRGNLLLTGYKIILLGNRNILRISG